MVTQYARHLQGAENLEVRRKQSLFSKKKILTGETEDNSVSICVIIVLRELVHKVNIILWKTNKRI